jgi:hypothetical protein
MRGRLPDGGGRPHAKHRLNDAQRMGGPARAVVALAGACRTHGANRASGPTSPGSIPAGVSPRASRGLDVREPVRRFSSTSSRMWAARTGESPSLVRATARLVGPIEACKSVALGGSAPGASSENPGSRWWASSDARQGSGSPARSFEVENSSGSTPGVMELEAGRRWGSIRPEVCGSPASRPLDGLVAVMVGARWRSGTRGTGGRRADPPVDPFPVDSQARCQRTSSVPPMGRVLFGNRRTPDHAGMEQTRHGRKCSATAGRPSPTAASWGS